LKHDWGIISIDAGMQIDRSRSHHSNADSPKVASLQPGLKVNSERCVQALKQVFESVSIDGGMQTG
jgi:hypothetical protein